MKRDEIQRVIRVGDPYLWLDEVVELHGDSIVAVKHLDENLPVFQGHYHGFPLFPGALQCEACFQACSVLIAQSRPLVDGRIPVIARVRDVKFRRLVRPGQDLRIEVAITDRVSQAYYLKGRVLADGQTSTQLSFVATEAAA